VLSDSILAKLQPEDADLATAARHGPTILFNGHTVQVSPDTSVFVDHEGKNYQLLQFHFHTPSENRMDGHSSASEMHLVHKASDGSLMVIAGLNDNPTPPPSHPSAHYSSALKSIQLNPATLQVFAVLLDLDHTELQSASATTPSQSHDHHDGGTSPLFPVFEALPVRDCCPSPQTFCNTSTRYSGATLLMTTLSIRLGNILSTFLPRSRLRTLRSKFRCWVSL
jgi:hypothetical protein